MPTIKRIEKKRTEKHIGENKAKVSKIYNSKQWKALRNAYIMQNPLCECCLERGITKAASEVHHITPILTGKDDLEMLDIALNPNNLKALCVECHHEEHNNRRRGSK